MCPCRWNAWEHLAELNKKILLYKCVLKRFEMIHANLCLMLRMRLPCECVVHVCACVGVWCVSGVRFALTQSFHGNDFILAQVLTGLVVSEAALVEQPALDALPAGVESSSDLGNRYHYSVCKEHRHKLWLEVIHFKRVKGYFLR